MAKPRNTHWKVALAALPNLCSALLELAVVPESLHLLDFLHKWQGYG